MKRMKKIFSAFLAGLLLCTGTFLLGDISCLKSATLTASAADAYSYDIYRYVYLSDGTIELTDCDASGATGELTLPNKINGITVTSIGDEALSGCTSITELTIPDTITKIGSKAFYNCYYLQTIHIPSSITSVGADAFRYCSRLSAIYITDITAWAAINFAIDEDESVPYSNPLAITENLYLDEDVTPISDIVLSSSAKKIGNYAFYGYSNLNSIAIPDGVTKIGTGAFMNCSSLTSVMLPASVAKIGEDAFRFCSKLSSIQILNPDCVIAGEDNTICTKYTSSEYLFDGTISGYDDSTAEDYANTYHYTFVSLGANPNGSSSKSLGDVDGDGSITITDASKALVAYANTAAGKSSGLSTEQASRADVDGNGEITIMDASYILQYYAYSAAGNTKSWSSIIK